MANFDNIADWLLSDVGKNALEHDNIKLNGYEDMIAEGKKNHDLKRAIGRYAQAAKELGFGRVYVETGKEGSKIIFRPTAFNEKVPDDECPSLLVSATQNGMIIRNGMPTVNNPILTRGASGAVGMASSLTLGIEQAADKLEEYTEGWKKDARNLAVRAKKIKQTTRIEQESITHLNPSLFSRHAIGDYNDALDSRKIANLSLEGQEIMKHQVLTGFYYRSLYNEYGKKGGLGAPRNEKEFTRQLQDIMDAARGSSNFNSLNAYVKGNYPWIYKNVWNGEVANLYKKVAGRITQSGKKEGAPGIMGLGEVDFAYEPFENPGRKPKQNFAYLRREATYGKKGSHASGLVQLHTKAQNALYKEAKQSIKQDLYYAGELTDDDILSVLKKLEKERNKKQGAGAWTAEDEKKFKERAIQIATKGFGKDASLMSASMAKDFGGMYQYDTLKGRVSQARVNEIVLKRLERELSQKKSNKELDEAAISKLASDELGKLVSASKGTKKHKQYTGMVKKALSSLYDLTTREEIIDFDYATGENGQGYFSNINTRIALDNHTMTARGGGTSDFRSVISALDDEILGWAYENHGYSKKDIYVNGKDASDGLKMHVARQATPLSDKTIRSELKRKTEYVLNRGMEEKGGSADEILKAIKGTSLEGVITWDNEDGWIINNDLAAKKFFHLNAAGGRGTPFKMLQEIVRLGESLGVYEKLYDEAGNKMDYYSVDKNGNIVQNKPLVDAMEVQVAAVDRYQGMGRETHSGSKFTWQLLQSLEGTLGEIQALGGEYAKGAKPVRTFTEKIASELAKKEKEYQQYVAQLSFFSNTFRNNATKAKKELALNESVITLSPEDIVGAYTDWEYESNGIESGVNLTKDEFDKTIEGILAQKRNARYEELVKKYGKENLNKRNIRNAKDIKAFLDFGDERLGFTDDNGQFYSSGLAMFGLGNMAKSEGEGDSSLYMPDDMAVANNIIAKAMQEYYSYTGSDREKAGAKALRKIREAYEDASYSVERGSIYDKFHTLEGDKSSGYLLLRALNKGSGDIFNKLFGTSDNGPSMVMSTDSAKAMFEAMGREELAGIYEEAFGKGKAGKKKRNTLIKELLEHYDVSSEGYSGAVMNSTAFSRSPTIKFASDILGGSLAFSSDKTIVNSGTLAINKDLAAASHGDMDGDRVAFFNAFMQGDEEGALEALSNYYDHLRENQRKAAETEEGKKATLKKVNSVADIASRNKKAVGMNAGAKGAGIYGNLLFGMQNIFRDSAISQGDKVTSPEGSFVANLTENIAHLLYQEGINTKNLKIKGVSDEEVALRSNEIMALVGQSRTWDTAEGMRKLLKKMGTLGITDDASKVFSSEQVANLNLMNIGKDSPEIKVLSEIAERAAKSIEKEYSKNSPEYKQIKADIKRINDVKSGKVTGLLNLSEELLIAVQTDAISGVAAYFNKGETFGKKVANQYKYIPGYSNEFSKMLKAATSESFDEIGSEQWKDLLARRAKTGKSDYSSQFLDLVKAKGLNSFSTSPSRRTKELVQSGKYKVQRDSRDLISMVDKALEGDSEAEDYLARQFKIEESSANILSLFGGTLAHAAAEDFRGGNDETRGNLEKISAKTRDRLIKLFGYSEAQANRFVEESRKKGTANGAYVDRNIARQGGRALGNEVSLAGFMSPGENGEATLSRQIADYLYLTTDENGKATVHVGDYKNTLGGSVSASNILQVKDYINSLQLLHDDILRSGDFTVDTYFGNDERSVIAEGWERRLREAAQFYVQNTLGLDADDSDYKAELREAYERELEEFEKLFSTLRMEDVNFKGELISHGSDHTVSRYELNANNDDLNKIYRERYLKEGADALSEEEQNLLTNNSDILTKTDTEFAGDQSDLEAVYSAEYDELRKYTKDIADKQNLIEKLRILKKAEERKLEPDIEKILKYDEEISKTEKELGEGLDKETVLQRAEELQKQIDESEKPEEKEELRAQLEELKKSLRYKVKAKTVELLKKGKVTNIKGDELAVSEAILDALTNENLAGFQGKLQNQDLSHGLASDQFIEHSKTLRSLEEQIQSQKQLSGSKFLSDVQKADIARNIENLEYRRTDVEHKLEETSKVLRDKSGNWLRKEDAEKLGVYQFTEEDAKAIAEKAQRHFNVSEQQKDLSFFNKAYGTYKTQYDLGNQIWKMEKDISGGKRTPEEMVIMQAELENLKKQKELADAMAPDIESFDGYTAETNASAQKKAQLEAELWRLKHSKNGGDTADATVLESFTGIDSFNFSWISRLLSGGSLWSFFRKLKTCLDDIINKAKQLDSAVTNLRIVTGETRDGATQMVDQYSDLAKELGTTTAEVTSAATEWLRQGYNVAEVNDLVKSSMYLSTLGMIDSATATKDLTSAMKGFKLEASEAMTIVDKLTTLDVKAATSAGDIAEGLAEFANLATSSGVDIDQASAYVATIADVTQQSGSSVGTAMKTILSRYGNVKASAYNSLNLEGAVDASDNSLNDVEKVLNKLGISMRDTNLEFKDFDDILDEIAEKWGTLDNVSKKAIAGAFAGVRQQEDFLVLMENYDTYQDFVKASQNASGTAETKYQSYLESYAATKNEFTAAIEKIANNSGIIKLLTDLTKTGTDLIEFSEKIVKFLPTFLASLASLKIAVTGKSMLSQAGDIIRDKIKGGKLVAQGSQMGNLVSWVKDRKSKKSTSKKDKTDKQELELIEKKAKETEKEKKALENQVSLKEKIATFAAVESSNKKEVADKASLEALKKANVITDAQLEEAHKQGVLTDAEMEQAKKQGVISYSSLEEMQKKGIVEDAKIEAAYKEKVKNSGAGEDLKVSKLSLALSGISQLSAGVAAAVSQFSTAATTHTYNGETVESSEGAQKEGASFAAVANLLSSIPVIGGLVGSIGTAVAEAIAGEYDKDRDIANAQTSQANSYISKLGSVSSSLKSIKDEEFGTSGFYDSIEAFSQEIFSEDYEETRALLEQYLGGDTSIYDVLSRIKDNTEDSAEAYRELQLAQLKAEKAQIAGKYASQLYNAQVNTNTAYADYVGYKGDSGAEFGRGVGYTLGGAAVGAGAGAALAGIGTLVGVAAANAWNPVGWGLMIAGAIAGLGVGITSAIKSIEASDEKSREEYANKTEWALKTNAERIAEVTKQIDAARADADNEYNKQIIANGENLLAALEKQISLSNQMLDEMDSITVQEALITANIKDNSGDSLYLSDMSVGQLKNLGIDKILLTFAKAIEANGGLADQGIWEDDAKTKLSEAGRSYVMTQLRKQDDEEINSVLSGESYTLNEVLRLRNKYGDTTWVTDLMKNFATSLGVTVDELEKVKNKYGELTYSETLMSQSELQERIGSFIDLTGEIISGTGATSEWMQTIIGEFPELIAYMSDTPTLLGKITEKLQELSEAAIQAEYSDVMDSESYFSTVEESFYSELLKQSGGSEAEKQLKASASMAKFSNVVSWIKGEYNSDTGELSEEGKAAYAALMATLDGAEITSDYLKEYYDEIIEAQTTIYDNEINNLTAQKEALEQINNQREYENKLIEAKLKLENAQKEKTRVYRAGVGWVYESDQSAILEAQENLASVENEKTVSSLEAQIAELNREKEKVSGIYDEQNAENLKNFYENFVEKLEGKGSDNVLTAIKDGIGGISSSLTDLVKKDLNNGFSSKDEALKQLKEDWENLQAQKEGTTAYNTALAKYQQTMTNAKKLNVTENDVSSYEGLSGLTKTGTGDKTAWEAGQSSNYDKLKYDIKQSVLLRAPESDLYRYSGVVKTGDTEYNPNVLNGIYKGVKDNKAIIWTSDGTPIKISDDARLEYHKSSDTDFLAYLERIMSFEPFSSGDFIITGGNGGANKAVYISSEGVSYGIAGTEGGQESNQGLSVVESKDTDESPHWLQNVKEAAASGSLGLGGVGNTLINEFGTEAIVTPSGTITALPSHTGIVPADITKNLWELGEIAPAISRTLMANIIPDSLQQNTTSSTTDESLNVNTMNISMNSDGSFDVDRFVSDLKSRVALTRNLNK